MTNLGKVENEWRPDDSQQQVIEVDEGFHLVLAPPGCGKTQILTERISRAHQQGVDFADMLCLTFTNRAARGMAERINATIEAEGMDKLFVGNVHRFCSRFLFNNNIIPSETTIIDDDDAVSILARYLGEDEYVIKTNRRRYREYADVFHLAAFMHQIVHSHPRNLRIHPECLSHNDVVAMRNICAKQSMAFDAEAMIDMYKHSDDYITLIRTDAYDYGTQNIAVPMLRKMELAYEYEKYKRENQLLDFEDLLMLTYDTLVADKEGKYKRFAWVQVDEVQDLNPLQLAIIDALTSENNPTVVYLGDEQQAIFSFMGAKMDTLETLKLRCKRRIHRLYVNHRSPKYLLDLFNKYATKVLGIDEEMLPTTNFEPTRSGDELKIVGSLTYDMEIEETTLLAERLFKQSDSDTTAIVVSSNRDAEFLSESLRKHRLSHFRVSGTDLFSSPEMKLLIAHASLLYNDLNFMAWARICKGVKVFERNSTARLFVRKLLDRAICPTDLLLYENGETYVQDFLNTCNDSDIVVFDTETTGLSVFDDDIVQIAAVKMRNGQIVEGSEFSIFMATDKPIPLMLGDIVNPLIEELKHHELLSHRDGLTMFMDYANGCVLLGHNSDYDYNILDNNLRRYCDDIDLRKRHSKCFDTLKLMRLLEPGLKEYKLKALLKEFQLDGSNSHLADEDVFATCSVVKHCMAKASEVVEEQKRFLSDAKLMHYARILKNNYLPFYEKAKTQLYLRDENAAEQPLVSSLRDFYDALIEESYILPLENIGHVFDFISNDVISQDESRSLIEQLSRHLAEISTFKEADLCGSSCLHERIYVTTVHKAKGLEFDNVIVFDVIDSRYPSCFNNDNPRLIAEDARKLYVAISRAKKRLYITHSTTYTDYHNQQHNQYLSRFLQPIMPFFG